MNIEINKTDIEELKTFLIRFFGNRNINNTSLNDIKKAILLNRLQEGIKSVKKGDIIYKFDIYKKIVSDFKEYVVFSIGSKNLLGSEDIIINDGGGYIAGGLNGYAVLKEDYNQYLKELEVLKNE